MQPEIPGYEIGERLHFSPLISVYLATREADGRSVVIKTLTSEYPTHQSLAEIRHEYFIALRLAGAVGVVEVYELAKYGYGNLGIVMEPFGHSLAQLMERRGREPLPINQFFDVAIGVAGALRSIHQRDIVHKDAVPRNILIDETTGAIRFIDFGISSELSREKQDANLARRLEGSLPYISPEQTGRMNRYLDYRSDYYTLGITFYELLTGRLPFHATDSLEWVHSHISRRPPPPREFNPLVPDAVAEIVLKLIAKNAEDRYQSLFGLVSDLERCRDEWRAGGGIRPFAPGQHDVSERFEVSQKLYGRGREIACLAAMLECAAAGEARMLLVSGHSGIGKTSLVNEINKNVVDKSGFIIQGKFDQVQRNTSCSALGMAFGGLMRQLMADTEDKLALWRTKISAQLGSNARLVVDLIPELANVIGEPPPLQKLTGEEAQNRFQNVLLTFIKTFAAAEHPLTIFLDDMQWSDAPTLSLLQRLFASHEVSHLLLICAYRSNEVDSGHPFRLALDEIERSREVEEIELTPLDVESVTAMIADTFRTDSTTARPLAELLYARTEGNPFFVNEWLKTLFEEKAVAFDLTAGRWSWDLVKARRTGISGNVVEFVVSRLRKLEPAAQHLLQLASCIGNTFDLQTLSVISECPPRETGAGLIDALQNNIIVPLDDNYRYFTQSPEEGEAGLPLNPVYKFQHDRIQQASYALIDEERRRIVHLSIGRLMLKHADEHEEDERLIEIVSHLDEGRQLIREADERRRLAGLNLRAAVRARDSSRYDAALRFLEFGREFLPADPWAAEYGLAMELTTEQARCAYLAGLREEAESCIDLILANARTNLEKADVLSIRTRQYATTGRMDESIEAAIQGLAILGFRFTRHPGRLDIVLETLKVKWNLRGRRIAEVADAPPLEEAEQLVAIRLLMEIFPAAFLSGSGNLLPYLVLKSVNISLRHGNCPETAFAYAAYGMVLCGVLDNPALGYEYGKLAIAINERLDDIRLKSRILYVYAMFVHHWSNHWSSMTPWFKKGIEAGYQTGDRLYLAYSAQDCIIWDPGIDLETSCEEQLKYLSIVRDCDYRDSLDSGTLFLQMQKNLRGLTADCLSLSDDHFDEQACLDGMRERKFMTGIANYHIYKLEICFAHEEYEKARHHIEEQDKLIQSSMALPQLVRYYFIAFLTLARLHPGMERTKQRETMSRMRRDIARMAAWAKICEANFLHLLRLMEAEMADLRGHAGEAAPHYAEAIALARKHGFRRDEALAGELFARFYLAAGQERAAEGYLRAAAQLYHSIGAFSKVRQLELNYRSVLEAAATSGIEREHVVSTPRLFSESARVRHDSIDMASVMKASRAISGEIVIDQLLRTVMEILLENAGGDRGCFVIHRNGELHVAARSNAKEDAGAPAVPSEPIPDGEDSILPVSIVRYALRTRENVVLDDASRPNPFEADPYIRKVGPKSVLCMPIVRKHDFEGAIYLENNLTAGAFKEERLEVMNLLAAQASISIENAQLYNSLEAKVDERTRELAGTLTDLRRTQSQLVHSEKMAGLGTLVAGVAHEINNPTNFVNLGAASMEEDLADFKALLFGMLGDDNDPEVTGEFEARFRRLQSALGNIHEGALRISTIVHDLRTFSRLDEAERKTVPLVENIESTLRLVRSQYQDGVAFVTDFRDDPEIKCLPAQLNQVFMNVIVNACQAVLATARSSAAGTKQGLVEISTRVEGSEAIIRVRDHGIGMSEEVRRKIFEPFFTTKEVGEGTGMGMSISYQIVERHGGRFEIDSAEGEGSTVAIHLPLSSPS
jgi:predicted ATPase/signal transduction histidine kinase